MRKSNIRQLVFTAIVLVILMAGCKKMVSDLSDNNSDVRDGRFRGFNLLVKFDVGWSNFGYFEKDFEMIHALAQIDDAISWGMKYDIHVNLNCRDEFFWLGKPIPFSF